MLLKGLLMYDWDMYYIYNVVAIVPYINCITMSIFTYTYNQTKSSCNLYDHESNFLFLYL